MGGYTSRHATWLSSLVILINFVSITAFEHGAVI